MSAKKSGDLICLVPQIYGAGGLVGNDNGGPLNATTGHEVHFQASALSSFGPINSQIGVELSQLPIATPVAGFLFAGGVLTPTENFGPVLTERAETIGKGKLFIGASYQYFNFDKVDGVNLRNFGIVLTHEQEPTVCPSPGIQCLDGEPVYTRDVIGTQNRVDLKVHQFTFVGTYGLTDNLDVSIAIPVLNVRMNMNSLATIFNFEAAPTQHAFDPNAPASNPHERYIDASDAIFSNPNTAMGVGDITLRGKYKAWQAADEKSAIAVGLDVRLPSGDSHNFLGSGTWGLRPFLTYTRSGRFSPHSTVGFQGNGSSVLAGNVTSVPVSKAKLPDIFTYSAGAEFGVIRRLSVASDFIGQVLLSAPQISRSVFTDFVGGVHANVSSTTDTVNEMGIALGGKAEIYRRLLLTGNVLFRVNDAGLHSKPAPLVGLSYTF
jgi:hypothetical protein